MSSNRRIESSRRNGALSRGPATGPGKGISSQNAIRHELCARSVILANESEPEILALRASLAEVYQPQDELDQIMVTQITVYTWRLFRVFGMEADLMNNELTGQAANPVFSKAKASLRTALAFDRAWANTAAFRNLNIYEGRIRREITRLESRLEARRRRKEDLTNEPSPKIGHLPVPPVRPIPFTPEDNPSA